MKIKSLIILLIGFCVFMRYANAVLPAVLFDTTNADKAAARATMRAKFLNSVGNSYNFEIVNNTNDDFADAFIQSNTGAEIYSPKPGAFSCAKHTICKFNNVAVKKPKTNGFWTFIFYGNDKNIVSAYVLANPRPGWNTVAPKDSYLGHYVVSEVENRYKKYKTTQDVGVKLDKINGKAPNYQNSHKAILEALASDIKSSHVINCNISEDNYFKKFKPNNNAKGSLGN